MVNMPIVWPMPVACATEGTDAAAGGWVSDGDVEEPPHPHAATVMPMINPGPHRLITPVTIGAKRRLR